MYIYIYMYVHTLQYIEIGIFPRSTGPRLMHLPETAVLGRGSFGTVWRAKDAHTGHCYAVPRCHGDFPWRFSMGNPWVLHEIHGCHFRKPPELYVKFMWDVRSENLGDFGNNSWFEDHRMWISRDLLWKDGGITGQAANYGGFNHNDESWRCSYELSSKI